MTVDRRVQRTRQLLRDALMALILDKGFEAITVQDITDRANLGRATLYLHYKDKEDLLIQSLQEGMDELIAIIEQRRRDNPDATPEMAFGLAFQHAAAHADLYRVLFSGQGSGAILVQIREYISTVIGDAIRGNLASENGRFPVEIASQFVSGALLMLLEWWLREEMPYTPDEMAGMVTTLVLPGLRNAFGRDTLFH